MEENRRQSDKRMDSLGKDIRELRESFIETHDTVIAINATLNDGMKSAINRSQNFINSYMTGIYQWWRVTNPATGYIAEKTSGWTLDSFSGGLEIDFSSVVPAGTKQVRVCFRLYHSSVQPYAFARAKDDPNISNTPNATNSVFADLRIEKIG